MLIGKIAFAEMATVLALAAFLCVGCGTSKGADSGTGFMQDEVSKAQGELERAMGNTGEGSNILGVLVVNGAEPTENNLVFVDTVTDTLHAVLSYSFTDETDIAIKFLVDYEEQSVEIDGTIYKTYVFHTETNGVIEIPFRLTNEKIDMKQSHILTVIAIPNANKNVGVDNGLIQRPEYAMDFEISQRNTKREIIPLTISHEPEKYLAVQYQGLMLNTDFDDVDNVPVNFPPKTFTVKAGETVKLAYRAGMYENTNNIAICVFLDFEQLRLNGEAVLNIGNKEDKISFGTFEFTAPKEAGMYDIVAFVSPAPYKLRNADNAHLNDVARRFTLIVE